MRVVDALRARLLAWYRRHARKLPWRDDPTPYRVLVSEAMLQQTQVATVIPYFERFMAAFPSVEALAAADEQRVLRLWQGLGYYRRARNLHAAARAIVERHGGEVPASVDDLLALPGVGRYTAGAIASIAHGVRAPILDGNVARVLARWSRIEEAVDAPQPRKRLWELAEALADTDAPGDANQAMMELGATVCTPRDPKCLYCPVAEWCEAQRAGVQHDLPRTLPKKARKPVVHQVLAIRRGQTYLFEQRPSDGLWSNMWQLPTRESDAAADPAALAAWARERYGLTVQASRPVVEFTHATTHRDIAFSVHAATVAAGRLARGSGVWRKLDAIDDLPLSKPQQRAVAALLNPASKT